MAAGNLAPPVGPVKGSREPLEFCDRRGISARFCAGKPPQSRLLQASRTRQSLKAEECRIRPLVCSEREARPMDESLRAHVEAHLLRLDGLTRRGQQLGEALAEDPSSETTTVAIRVWQEDCGTTIHQLSGGSKAHWLARSFSEAFLVRSAAGQAIEGVDPKEIIQRLLGVLEKAVASLSRKDDGLILSESPGAPPRRFEFVHNLELRPIVEQAFLESRQAFEQGDYDRAMRTSCGILEAILTDALEHIGPAALAASGAPTGKIAEWPFETRLVVAERTGLIRGGCARLPEVARRYREHRENGTKVTISEQEARRTGQVLRVVMTDLNPGR